MPSAPVESPPSILYKYYNVSEYSLKVLRDDKVFFSDPIKDFNDPFDCRLEIDFTGSLSDWQQSYAKFLSRQGISFTRDSLRRESKSLKKRMDKPKGRKEFLNDNASRNGIFCLCEVVDDILMFSHYADGHKGYCVGFSSKRIKSMLDGDKAEGLMPVDYIDALNPPNWHFRDDHALIKWTYMTKSKKWEYEREWRCISEAKHGETTIPDQTVTEIVLGCRMLSADARKIMEVNARRKYPAKMFKAVMKGSEIGLDIVAIR